jgi:hypothetical protein
MKTVRFHAIPLCVLFAGLAHSSQAAPPDFAREIAPLLREHCVKCHGPEKQKGGLRFDVKGEALKKGDSGERSIVPGKSAESELLRRVTSTDKDLRMPSEGEPLTPEQIDLLRRWIDGGADWPDGGKPAAKGEMIVTAEDRRHWSFRPLGSPAPPDIAWNSEIDKFVVASLSKAGLKLSPPASARTLVRRIYFDLIGLPPRREEIAEFEAAYQQDSFAAVAALVDRLLATQHYGERWGRHWLDVARYADSDGQESDADRPFAYQYRDFVIKSLNDDLPYDEFVRWQIAGDELAPDNPQANAATGFLIAGPHSNLETIEMEDEKLRSRYDELDDTIATLGSSMLGLTLACTRCHDHKYDAIPTRDYYRLMAAFHTGKRRNVPLGSRAELQKYDEAKSAWDHSVKEAESALQAWLGTERKPLDAKLRGEKIAALQASDEDKATLRDQPESAAGKKLAKKHEQALAIGKGDLKRLMSDEQRRKWDELAAAVNRARQAEPPAPSQAFAFRDEAAEPKTTWLFHRANYYDKSEPVQLGFVTVLTSAKSPEAYWSEAKSQRDREGSTYQRAALAKWITDVEQGAGALLARVIVNRAWRHHFGEGIVRTPSDFGVQGERPSHPELLEWLTSDFVSNGWRLKRLHRQIVLSGAYQQGSEFSAAAAKIDPDNRLLWHRRPIRLEAEALRDAMLVCAGTLNREQFGPGFKPPIAAEAMVARNLKSPYNAEPADSPNIRRRSVYMFHKRVVPYPLLQAFDRPDALQSCSRRDTTTVAPQALAILKDQFVRDRAVELAGRLGKETSSDPDSSVRSAFAITVARTPSDSELQSSTTFIAARQAQRQQRGMSAEEAQRAALADFCQTLFGLNEFLYVD